MPEDNYKIQNSSSNHREALSLSARMTRNAEMPSLTKTKERLSLKFLSTSPLLKPDDKKPLTVQKRKSDNHFHDNYVSNTSRQMQASSFFDDDFAKFLRVTCGASVLMRKDRNGTAIQKGSKKHKITFRDEIPVEKEIEILDT